MADTDEIHETLSSYLHKLDALKETLPYIMVMAYLARRMATAKKSNFLKEHGKLIDSDENGKSYEVKLEHQNLVERLDKKVKRASTAYDILPSKFVVSFVSEYDAFLGNLVKDIFRLKPELLDGSDRNLSFAELKEMGSVEAAYEHILEKEVEALLRKSHSDQFDWLEKRFGVQLRKGLTSWPPFVEITERRNLFVHCDGVVSQQYMAVCRRNDVLLGENVKIGEKLDTSKEYLTDAYRCLYEIGVKLAHVLWRKLFPDDLEAADTSLTNVTYSLIHEGEYELAKCLLDFSVSTLKHWSSDSMRRVFVINRAQAYYHSGDTDGCKEILTKEDWSACGNEYRICVAVLENDYDKAAQIMKRIGKSGPISEADYLDWPVFRDFRSSECFVASFKEVFDKEPVNISSLLKQPDIDEILSEEEMKLTEELKETSKDSVPQTSQSTSTDE